VNVTVDYVMTALRTRIRSSTSTFILPLEESKYQYKLVRANNRQQSVSPI
jgi:hypothetical protein